MPGPCLRTSLLGLAGRTRNKDSKAADDVSNPAKINDKADELIDLIVARVTANVVSELEKRAK
jgi:hypothetical protein